MEQDFQLENSGTFDLAGSIPKTKVAHITTFGHNDSVGMYNLGMYKNIDKEELLQSSDLRISQSHDPFNLSSSGRLPEVGKSDHKKYAVIDHFRHEEDLQENLSNSIREKERKQIQALLEQEKQREAQEQREFEMMEKAIAGTKKLYENNLEKKNNQKQDGVSPARVNERANRPGSAMPGQREESIMQHDETDRVMAQSAIVNQPQFPQFEEQLKEIRESYAKQFEEKMQRGFQELSELKKDIASKQEVFDTKQVRDLRREIKRLQDELLESQNSNIDLTKQVQTLKLLVKEKDTVIDKINNGSLQKEQVTGTLQTQLRDKDLQIEAMLVKMELFKKNIDELNFKYLDAQKLLEQMKTQDFARQNLILKRQTAELTDALALKQSYLDDLKQNMKLAMQSISNSSDHKQQSAIFSNLLENLSQENVKGRRLVDELQKRENICQRKWNKLLQENLDLQDKLNGHHQQLQRTREQYQAIVQNNERKLLEANQRLAWLQNQEDKRAAAEFLVDQMRIVNEEKQQLVHENQSLQQHLTETTYDYQKLERDLKDFLCFRSGQEIYEFATQQDQIAQNTQRLVLRVEELEDLVVELKSKQSANEVTELKALVAQLELDCVNQLKLIKVLQQKRICGKDLFERNEMHSSYLQIMREREKVIDQLHQQLKRMGDQVIIKRNNIQSFGNPTAGFQSEASSTNKGTLGNREDGMGTQTDDFEEEKLKDAVNFQNLMKTMQQSHGFAGIHHTAQQSQDAPYVQPRVPSVYGTERNHQKEQVFANFSKADRDEWLLNSSQNDLEM